MLGVQFQILQNISVTVLDMGKEENVQRTANFCRMLSSLWASEDVTELQRVGTHWNFELNWIRYKIYRKLKEEMEKVTLRSRPKNLIQ
jgi:hypothetical protein